MCHSPSSSTMLRRWAGGIRVPLSTTHRTRAGTAVPLRSSLPLLLASIEKNPPDVFGCWQESGSAAEAGLAWPGVADLVERFRLGPAKASCRWTVVRAALLRRCAVLGMVSSFGCNVAGGAARLLAGPFSPLAAFSTVRPALLPGRAGCHISCFFSLRHLSARSDPWTCTSVCLPACCNFFLYFFV